MISRSQEKRLQAQVGDTMTAYWLISHDPDLTETGYPQRRTYLRTKWTGFPAQRACEQQIIQDWCRERFGAEVAYVQGVAATPNWTVAPSCEVAFEQAAPIVWGGYSTDTRRVEIHIGNGGKTTVIADYEAKR